MEGQQRLRRKAAKFETVNQQRQKKVIRRRIFYISLFLLLTVSFFVVCFTLLFKVKEIVIKGQNKYSTANIIELTNIKKGDNLYSFETVEIVEMLQKKMPYIKEVSIKRSLPSTVTIEIIEEDAVFFTQQNNEIYLLNRSLTVLERIIAEKYLNAEGLIELKTGDIKKCIVSEKLIFYDKRKSEVMDELTGELIKYDFSDKINFIDIQSRFDILFGYEESRFRVYMGDISNCNIKINFLNAILREVYAEQRGKIDISDTKEAIYTPDD